MAMVVVTMATGEQQWCEVVSSPSPSYSSYSLLRFAVITPTLRNKQAADQLTRTTVRTIH